GMDLSLRSRTDTFGVARRELRGIGRLAPSRRRHVHDPPRRAARRLVGSSRLLVLLVRRASGRGTVEPSTDTPVEVANPRAVRRRRVLSGVALVLACLT